MEKRYQVFVSSTYADLKDERQRVIQTLMEMDCIPTGMELFPAADEEQWQFIKRVIDDCDYYLLIIGGRYGSLTSEGLSYTEKEYEYAVERNIRVIALLQDPDEIPTGKLEEDLTAQDKLKRFREKVSSGRLIKYWRSAEDLSGLVAISLQKTMKAYPAMGWIRANRLPSEALLTELNEVRKENEKLKVELEDYKRGETDIPNLALLEEPTLISGTWYRHGRNNPWSIEISWKDIFALIAPHILEHPSEESVKSTLTMVLFRKASIDGEAPYIDAEIFHTIKIQLLAHGLINAEYLRATSGGMAIFWSLTPKGKALMMDLRTIRKNSI